MYLSQGDVSNGRHCWLRIGRCDRPVACLRMESRSFARPEFLRHCGYDTIGNVSYAPRPTAMRN